MKNALNNQVGMLGDMFLWLVANLKQGGIYFIKQALPPNISAGSVVSSKFVGNDVKSFSKNPDLFKFFCFVYFKFKLDHTHAYYFFFITSGLFRSVSLAN